MKLRVGIRQQKIYISDLKGPVGYLQQKKESQFFSVKTVAVCNFLFYFKGR